MIFKQKLKNITEWVLIFLVFLETILVLRKDSLTRGFSTNFTYKNIDVNCMIAYSYGKYILNNNKYFIENSNFSQFNQTTNMENMWTTPGQVTNIPKVGEKVDVLYMVAVRNGDIKFSTRGTESDKD